MALARAIVFANGDYSTSQLQRVNATNADYIVCVDGGVRHCLSEGLTPDVLVGDLDSLDQTNAKAIERLGTQRIQYPAEKDASDLELALDALHERYNDKSSGEVGEVIVLGASGGRSDHHLFNWQLFASRIWSFDLRIVDATVDAQVIDHTRPFNNSIGVGQTFSVVPVAGVATGVNVIGARYPLSNATLKPGSTLGLSNLVSDTHLQISVDSGIVLAMFVHS